MATEKVKTKDMTEFEGPVDTGDAHGKRAADKRKVGDMQPDESVAKAGRKGSELPGTTTVGEELEALFGDVEGLSEDFVSKASTIFEGAVSEKVGTIKEEMEAEYNQRLEEAYETISEDLENKLDEYLNLFVETFMKENEIAIENGFRQEIAEEVIRNVVGIVESAGVDIPDDKIDLADALIRENEEIEGKYNEVLTENIDLKKSVRKYEIAEAFNTNTEGLTEARKDKLRRLTENMEFSSVEQFTEKLEVLKESFTDGKRPVDTSDVNLTEATDGVEETKITDPKMARYLAAARGNVLNI